jgi:hypothetical protein
LPVTPAPSTTDARVTGSTELLRNSAAGPTALQADAGRSNKQVALGILLSIRTAESHLQQAYEKLGIASRHELPEALRDQPTA